MWRFERSQYLILLLLAPAFLALFYFYANRWKRVTQRAFGARVVPYMVQNYSVKKSFWKVFCLSMALSFFVLAWARRKRAKSRGSEKRGCGDHDSRGRSRSMLAEDVRPSRLEHAKKRNHWFARSIGGDKVGLVAFAGSAVAFSPHSGQIALKMFVEGLSPNSVETQGTEIGQALTEPKRLFAAVVWKRQ